jgi:DNA processing protein
VDPWGQGGAHLAQSYRQAHLAGPTSLKQEPAKVMRTMMAATNRMRPPSSTEWCSSLPPGCVSSPAWPWGIDGASHRGALTTRQPGAMVGVAASGVDRVYPARHHGLWAEVVELGAVVSETPPGYPAQTWRFPARSLITADAAIERGIEVQAVPGPVHSPASAGTNQLLYDGPGPVRDATDILTALGPAVPIRPVHPPARARSQTPAQSPPTLRQPPPAREAGAHPPPSTAALLEIMGWQPRTLNWIVARHGSDVAAVAAALDRLAAQGRVRQDRGWWHRLA